jgi:predicted peptidase
VLPEQLFEEHLVRYYGGRYRDEVFRYRLLKPSEIKAGETYPLILYLHGAGERGDDNVSQLKYLPEQMSRPEWQMRYPCFLIAPQCRSGEQWVDHPWSSPKSVPMMEPTDQMKVAIQILEQVQSEQPIDASRIYLTGLSMGGYGSWELAMRMPERFAAVAPICGGGDERQAARLVGVPIWAWHGDADAAVPVERSRRMIDAIKKAGGNPKYTELEGIGHNSWIQAYDNPQGVVPWLFSQRRHR